MNKSLEFFCQIRFIRNGLDHTKATFVNIEDFNHEAGELSNPIISLNRIECILKSTNFKEYINEILKVYPYIFEMIITMVADDNIENNVFGFRIKELPEEQRRFKNVRFAFWSPIGKGGFYNMNM